ncbi:ATP synthase subunit I [Peptoniphilus sp. KCTC 25270]|uniref:ATP synthase subunit I n=1 Tax=Peptoniphilus sp. KCTC 25270 TaxID=2897414 RepID=UPI001E44A9F2|nr:ATP synthase subunit I [Peptoniphilus sp. KCTC 25270]MCD1147583.1 ATP synthase subunit I [Peptoniphilus sp. KCTC 25270]
MKDRLSNEYILKTAGVVLVLVGVFFFVFKDPYPYILGLIFGSAVSMAMFKQLYFTIRRSLEKTKGSAQVYTTIQYFIRYIIYGIVIFVGAKADYLNLWTTLLGLVSVKYVIIGNNLYTSYRGKGKEEKNEERNHTPSSK